MDDGVHLAADVYLPENFEEGDKLPVLAQFERYWRSSVKGSGGNSTPQLYGRAKYFSDHGYVIVIIDTRGSGASFGKRLAEYSPEEVMDAGSVLDWIVDQSWSDGNIGSFGTSYTGTTAELLCATKHSALKAVIPGWSDFDLYRSPVRPYGMLASSFIRKWGMYVRFLDRNRGLFLGSKIYPVVEDSLKPALKEHRDNLKVYRSTKEGPFRNSIIGTYDYEECSVVHWEKEIEESNVPMFVMASWMDAGTAEGTLQRLEHFSNPQKVLLMSTAHGGWSHASPFVVSDSLLYPQPHVSVQNKMQLDFLDYHLKGIDTGVEDWPLIQYYNMGEEAYKTSDTWPLNGTNEKAFYFQENGLLNNTQPEILTGSDSYKVDFGVSTSEQNRWTTQMEGGVLNLDNRNEMDDRMLVYTTAPVDKDVQITGTPLVHLKLSSTHEDGAVFVYLEDVDENGKSTYITEGGLRLIHRKELKDSSVSYNLHSFNEEDAAPMVTGKTEVVSLKMWPTSVLIKKGHAIRIAISGADKSTFDKCPKNGTPRLTIERNSANFSFVVLPIINQ
jgi:putative CocE/NonD family hydrolase